MLYHYRVTEILSVYDGDTLTLMIDKGFNTFMKVKVRLARVNTPEIRTRNKKEKAAGYAARDFLRDLTSKYKDAMILNTTKKGKYGRWIGELIIEGPCEDLKRYQEDYNDYLSSFYNVNDMLVYEGHAKYVRY